MIIPRYDSPTTGGRLRLELPAGMAWNHWPPWRGMGGRNGVEYAEKLLGRFTIEKWLKLRSDRMHPDTIFPNPVFIPKLIHIDAQFTQRFEGAEAFLVPGNFFTNTRYRNLCETAPASCDQCIIDPVTNAFTYDGFLDKPTYRGLPYSPNQVLTALDFRADSGALEQFVQSVIDFQDDNGADILIAPYFFARDVDDGRFMVNLDLASASLAYVERDNIEKPLFLMLNIGSSCIDNPRILNMVVDQYNDFNVQGYFVCVENFDDRTVSYEQLMGLAQLCRELSSGRDLIVSTIASFGQVLCSLGINAFVGGVGWLETFREANLRRGREGFGAQEIPRAQYYYIPELFSYVRPDDMEDIFNPAKCPSMTDYRCTCPACEGELPTAPLDKKTHFLHSRFKELQALSEVAPDGRPDHMRERLSLALALAEDIENEVLIRIPTEHLVRWLNVLDAISTSPSPSGEEEVNLEELIREARQED